MNTVIDDGMLVQIREWIDDNPLRKWRHGVSPEISLRNSAILLNVTSQTVYMWERGERVPEGKNMESIERLTGIIAMGKQWEEWINQRPKV